MAGTVQMDSAPGFPASEFVVLFPFAVMCLFGYTAHDLTAGFAFTWTYILLARSCIYWHHYECGSLEHNQLCSPHGTLGV
jgi:hypothetical protein